MSDKRLRLEGKLAVVTAAAQGIGRATVLDFVEEGCRVVAVDVNEAALNDLSHLAGVTVKKVDVLDKAAVECLAREYKDADVVFNCVGYVHQGTLFECDEEAFDLSYNLNVKSMFYMCKAFVPNMAVRGKGSIINMSSIASSVKGLPARFAYGTTKAAVIGMTKALAVDLVEKGIRVNCVCPGTVDTPSWRARVQAHSDPEQAARDFIARQKMKRLGRPEEIASLITYLASEESSYVTGTEFVIDGGISM